MCGSKGAPDEALRVLVGLASCCLGAAEGGPADCTCWEPVFDLVQVPPVEGLEPQTRPADVPRLRLPAVQP